MNILCNEAANEIWQTELRTKVGDFKDENFLVIFSAFKAFDHFISSTKWEQIRELVMNDDRTVKNWAR